MLLPHPRPTARLTAGHCTLLSGSPAHTGRRGQGAVWFGESPWGARAQPSVSGELLLVFEALS